jgi:hypothetical protein
MNNCEHENKEYHPYQPTLPDEPGRAEGYYCPDCGEWLEMEDEATRLGI